MTVSTAHHHTGAVGRKPRLLDLFCCAGGAGVGYERAGFEVTGVDIVVHKRNPHRVIEADCLGLDPAWIAANFDAVHASPKCQGQTRMRAPGRKQHVNQIPDTIALLEATGLPWVLENVEGAEPWMPNALTLCGSMFGLGAQGCQLQRHRLFIANFPITAPSACRHSGPVIGVYGGHARKRSAMHGGRGTRDVWEGGHLAAASEAMGIDWMTLAELSEAIPPAYTEWLGRQLLARVRETVLERAA